MEKRVESVCFAWQNTKVSFSVLFYYPNLTMLLFHCLFTEVVSYRAKMKVHDLALSESLKKSGGNVIGKAAQSFHVTNEENPAYPGFIAGSLALPPEAIKDAESVGLCAQIFTVIKGQEKCIEIAYCDTDQTGAIWEPNSAQRFLVSVGDQFLIPPGNSYRMENHSKTTEALLSWVIIRHNKYLVNEESNNQESAQSLESTRTEANNEQRIKHGTSVEEK